MSAALRVECPLCGFRLGWVPENGQWICVGCGGSLPWDDTYSATALSISYAVLKREFLANCDALELLEHQVANWKKRAEAAESRELIPSAGATE